MTGHRTIMKIYNCELKLRLFKQLNEQTPFPNKCCVMIAVCVVCLMFLVGCSHRPDSVASFENSTDLKQRNAASMIGPTGWPVEEEPATDYMLAINGQPVFVHRARVSAYPFNQWWPGYQRPLEQTEIASFATWDMDRPVEVCIVSTRPVKNVRIRPQSYGIEPNVDGNTICFTVKKPGQITVEVNDTHRVLHLFANPPEENTPEVIAWEQAWNQYNKSPYRHLITTRPEETIPGLRYSKVLYFGPGVHCPGIIQLKSNQTVYIAEGAVVYGAIVAEKAENISIIGRGILDGSKFGRMTDWQMIITLYDCKNVRVEGIILRDPSVFTIGAVATQQLNISNIKIIGSWRYNSDGIDLMNCQNCSIENSFIRSFDDSIVLKGYKKWGGRAGAKYMGHDLYAAPVQNIQVRRCVIWNDWGRALEIGIETVATEISGIVFEDCDIIHATHVAMDVQIGDRALCRDIIFENIRVELDYNPKTPKMQGEKNQKYEIIEYDHYIPKLIEVAIKKGIIENIRGHIKGIQFKNINVISNEVPPSELRGFDAEHVVENISIENLYINRQAISSLEAGGFTANEFVRDVSIKNKDTYRLYSDSESWERSSLKFSKVYGGVELDPKWKFIWDPNDEGFEKKWFSEEYDVSKWFDIGVDSCWEEQPIGKEWKLQRGIDYDGFGWYRNQFIVISVEKSQRIILNFGAVDEACKIWVNGQFVLDRPFPYEGNYDSWQEAFEVDITEYVHYDQPNVLTVRVEDNLFAGGIWRPVKLFVSE